MIDASTISGQHSAGLVPDGYRFVSSIGYGYWYGFFGPP
jgi:hypothetical protein